MSAWRRAKQRGERGRYRPRPITINVGAFRKVTGTRFIDLCTIPAGVTLTREMIQDAMRVVFPMPPDALPMPATCKATLA